MTGDASHEPHSQSSHGAVPSGTPGPYQPSALMMGAQWMRRRYRPILIVAGVIALIWIGNSLSNVLNPLLAALMLAYILNPIVNFFERNNVRRTVVVGAIIIALFWVVGGAIVVLVDTIAGETDRLIKALPSEKYSDRDGNGEIDEDILQLGGVLYRRVEGEGGAPTEYYRMQRRKLSYRPALDVFPRKEGIEYKALIRKSLDVDVPDDIRNDELFDVARNYGKVAYEDFDADGKFTARTSFETSETILIWDDADGELYRVMISRTYEDDPKPTRLETDDIEALTPAEYVDVNDDGHFNAGLFYKARVQLQNLLSEYNRNRQPRDQITIDSMFASIETDLRKSVNTETVTRVGGDAMSVVGQGAGAVVNIGLLLLLVPVYTFFCLKEMNWIKDKMIEYLPAKQKRRILDILFEIHVATGAFFRGRLFIAFLVFLLTSLGLAAIGAPFPIVFGAINAIVIIIPFASTVLGMLPTMVIAYLAYDTGSAALPMWGYLGLIAAVFIVVQMLEQFVFVPFILGREVELHPLVLIVAMFIGADVFGMFGVLIAVPLTCIIKILSREFVLPKLRQWAEHPLAEGDA